MIEVRAHILPVIDNQLGRAMSDCIEAGWEIMYPPQYIATRRAFGYNTATSEHFLLVVKREAP